MSVIFAAYEPSKNYNVLFLDNYGNYLNGMLLTESSTINYYLAGIFIRD